MFLALVWLSVKVNANPATGASDEELTKARAYHSRNKRGTASVASRPPSTRSRTTTPRSRVKRRTPKNENSRERTRVKRRSAWDKPRVKPMRNIKLSGGISRGKELREKMREANKSYDRQEYDEAVKSALDILKKHPRNIRMLRVVVSSSCFMGEPDRAKKYYAKLPKRDKSHMRIRCSRMKIKLDE